MFFCVEFAAFLLPNPGHCVRTLSWARREENKQEKKYRRKKGSCLSVHSMPVSLVSLNNFRNHLVALDGTALALRPDVTMT